jgi:hypothetical protein
MPKDPILLRDNGLYGVKKRLTEVLITLVARLSYDHWPE